MHLIFQKVCMADKHQQHQLYPGKFLYVQVHTKMQTNAHDIKHGGSAAVEVDVT